MKELVHTKKKYFQPKLSCTTLDNSISLELQSTPPIGPGEHVKNNLAPEFFNNQPMKA